LALAGLDVYTGVGFSEEEIDQMLNQNSIDIDMDINDHDSPVDYDDQNQHDTIPDNIEPLTKPGDIITIGDHVLHCGDCIEVLKRIDDNHIDAIVCDPPYGIGFMSKGWDCSVPSEAWAKECLRVLKPGGHIVAFGATRTIHRLTVAIEDAGFEIRDQIAWCYFSGFPKSHDISKAIDKHFGAEREIVGIDEDWIKRTGFGTSKDSSTFTCSTFGSAKGNNAGKITAPSTEEAKQFDGYGTALKPAYEPAVLARKPLTEKNIAENVLEWGTGGINIDDCRFGYGDPCWVGPQGSNLNGGKYNTNQTSTKRKEDATSFFTPVLNKEFRDPGGRWPANLYQCPKASRREREEGCEDLAVSTGAETVNRKEGSAGLNNPRAGAGRTAKEVYNIHPTVKPVRLMRWLCRLLAPPNNPVILDTFCGSGTTMIAAELEGIRSIGIERQPEYCDIIRARVENAVNGDDNE
jgi:site-specific DNA-methyltransferase (adenine-specific)